LNPKRRRPEWHERPTILIVVLAIVVVLFLATFL
jgi:hypothetical protein